MTIEEELAHSLSTACLPLHDTLFVSSSSSASTTANPSFVRSDLYEERETLKSGVGIFATQPILPGTRIFCEAPLIVLPDDAGHTDLHLMVKSLPEAEQKEFWSLAASSKPRKDVSWIDEIRMRSDDDSEDFNGMIEEMELAMSIWETNRFSMRFLNEPKRLGLFLKAARINHSCAPNVFHRYNCLNNRLTIHSLRLINPGEELYTSYIDICHPTVTRRQLLKHWGFRCRCTACDSPDDEEDYHRKQLEDLISRIRKRSEWDLKGDSEAKKERVNEKTLGIVEKVIKIMKKLGMEETDTLGQLYAWAVRFGVKVGRGKDAVEWAKKVVEIERKCVGEDSKEYVKAVGLVGFADDMLKRTEEEE